MSRVWLISRGPAGSDPRYTCVKVVFKSAMQAIHSRVQSSADVEALAAVVYPVGQAEHDDPDPPADHDPGQQAMQLLLSVELAATLPA